MMKTYAFAAVAAAVLSCSAADAAVINLASVDTTTGGAPTATTLTLGPGTYTATTVGTAGGGLYDAWSYAATGPNFYPTGTPNPAANSYTERYGVTVNGVTTEVNANTSYASAAAALAASSIYTFSLAATTAVSFNIDDNFYADNTGGVSLDVAAVPEPASWAMMIVGFGVAGGALRGRARRGVTALAAA